MTDLQRVLDVMMRATLTELQLCSHVPAQSFSPTGGHVKPGTVEPSGDVCVIVFREQLPASAVDFVVELDERYGTRLAARLAAMYPSMGEEAA